MQFPYWFHVYQVRWADYSPLALPYTRENHFLHLLHDLWVSPAKAFHWHRNTGQEMEHLFPAILMVQTIPLGTLEWLWLHFPPQNFRRVPASFYFYFLVLFPFIFSASSPTPVRKLQDSSHRISDCIQCFLTTEFQSSKIKGRRSWTRKTQRNKIKEIANESWKTFGAMPFVDQSFKDLLSLITYLNIWVFWVISFQKPLILCVIRNMPVCDDGNLQNGQSVTSDSLIQDTNACLITKSLIMGLLLNTSLPAPPISNLYQLAFYWKEEF